MKRIALLATSLILFTTAQAHAIGITNCLNIKWKPGKTYHITGSLNHATHITLPYKLLLDPIIGNADLWVGEGKGTHIVLKPTSMNEEGISTSVTAIDINNNSYNFIINRVDEGDYNNCVNITDNGRLIAGGDKLANYKSPEEKRINSLERQVTRLEKQVEKEQQTAKRKSRKHAEDAVRKYRGGLYTNYQFKSKSPIVGVYDDGRFTYVRLNDENRKTALIRGRIEDKDEILESSYDEIHNLYVVTGVFDKMRVQYNNKDIVVKRDSNSL